MLTYNTDPTLYRILSIDPGSFTLGWALLDLCLVERVVTVENAGTFCSVFAPQQFPFLTEQHGDRYTRLHHHQNALSQLLDLAKPQTVICESPYLGRFPQAFETLVECLSMLRFTVADYDLGLAFETVDPPSAKKAVGASGRGGDKQAVRLALSQLTKLRWGRVALNSLDEHAVDAIAVGCYKVRTLSDDFLF